ncbi:hypothetical protein PENSPDRAFT_735220 [Peniophora sp. CONT]|nr:hypothetical protein PENSPDRAFT_735220 [Peniophora sp. CONT]
MATTETNAGSMPQEGVSGPSNVSLPSKPKPKNVDIKNGKVVFKQKPISFEKATETMQETVKFREFLESRVEKSEPPLDIIPTEFWPLVAKFVHESDKTATALAKHVHALLIPETDIDSDSEEAEARPQPLTLDAVESCIKSVAQRTNYGVDGQLGRAPPAALCVWRWELASSNIEWLPKASREKAVTRLAERVQMQKELQMIFDAFPLIERNAMLGIKADAPKPKPQPLSTAPSNDAVPISDASNTPQKDKEKAPASGEAENGQDAAAKKAGRPKNPETAAKEQERLERKAAKAEKEKKAKEAQAKSQSMMASFFKTKASPQPVLASTPSTPSVSVPTVSDFDKTFKPFVLKKGSVMAPVNAFRVKRRREEKEVIVIDDEDEVDEDGEVEVIETPVDVSKPGYKPTPIPGATPASALIGRAAGFKTYHPDPVRALLTRLSEAEVTGDATLVRQLTNSLHDRSKYPAKVLIFHEDARPGYFGTFTRRSRLIGGRSPLVKDDAVLDYGYESGDDWNEEEGGEDVADGAEGEDEDEGSAEEDEMDGWLVGDDEEDERAVTPIEEREGLEPFDFPLPPPSQAKRKAEPSGKEREKEESRAKKRKVVVPLVPFVKGPCWETEIGRCEYEPFVQYRIQFFNDAPSPLDPFTFVSQPISATKHAPAPALTTTAPAVVPSSAAQPIPGTSTIQFAVPALPPHVSATATATDPTTPKKPKPTPKSAFPDTHLSYLQTKVSQMNTGSLPLLVDAVYQDLKVHKVKKNAIEAKIREVCAKSKGGGAVWALKADSLVQVQPVVKMEV